MIIILILFLASFSFGECVESPSGGYPVYNAFGQHCSSRPTCQPEATPQAGRCCSGSKAGEYCFAPDTYKTVNPTYYYGVVSEKSSPISGCTYSQFCSDACGASFVGNSVLIYYEWRCTSQREIDSLVNSLNQTQKDTICLNIPASISAQLGTGARAYYEKDEDGNLKKILNAENAPDLCRRAIAQNTGETEWLDNLTGPDGENYGSFCVGSCESQNISNGGVTSCGEFGCRGTTAEGVNPNDYTAGSGAGGAFGGGSGGGFGSGGGGGADGGESGAIGDSLFRDTSEVPTDFGSGCKVFDPILCNCDDYVYTGNSGNRAHLYNHKTGLTGSCAIDYLPEYPSCPVDFNNCFFPKTLNDSTFTPPDSTFFDTASGTTQLNYFPILNDINSSIKALDYNQNNNAKSMQDFFNNYTGTNFGGGSGSSGENGASDTTIIQFPDTSINTSNWLDTASSWRERTSGLVGEMDGFNIDSLVSDTNMAIDTVTEINEILDVVSSITDSMGHLFNINFNDLGGSSNCPAFLTQTRHIETYVGSKIPMDFSSLCTTTIFGKPLFELIRVVLRLMVSVTCAWAIFKATVGFREN